MPEYEITWLPGADEPWPTTAATRPTTYISATDFAGAVWEATRLLRAKVRDERAAVNVGLYGGGFMVRPVRT